MKPQEELRHFKMSKAQGYAPHTAFLLIMHQELLLHQQSAQHTFRLLATLPQRCQTGFCSCASTEIIGEILLCHRGAPDLHSADLGAGFGPVISADVS